MRLAGQGQVSQNATHCLQQLLDFDGDGENTFAQVQYSLSGELHTVELEPSCSDIGTWEDESLL